MRGVLLPIKNLAQAKQRLAPVLPAPDRARLMAAMMADMFAAVRAARHAARVFVVTSAPQAMAAARDAGWEVLEESEQTSESASVDWASSLCAARGITALLRLPCDLPLVRGADIDALLTGTLDEPTALMVPSRDGTGTNALLRSPPTLFPSRFGPDSLVKHIAEAERAGARVDIRRNPRLEMDVDDLDDLLELLTRDLTGTFTGDCLAALGVQARIAAI